MHDPNRPYGFNVVEQIANNRALQQREEQRIREQQRHAATQVLPITAYMLCRRVNVRRRFNPYRQGKLSTIQPSIQTTTNKNIMVMATTPAWLFLTKLQTEQNLME